MRFAHRFAGSVLTRNIINIIYASQRVAEWHEIIPVPGRVLKNKKPSPAPAAAAMSDGATGAGSGGGK